MALANEQLREKEKEKEKGPQEQEGGSDAAAAATAAAAACGGSESKVSDGEPRIVYICHITSLLLFPTPSMDIELVTY